MDDAIDLGIPYIDFVDGGVVVGVDGEANAQTLGAESSSTNPQAGIVKASSGDDTIATVGDTNADVDNGTASAGADDGFSSVVFGDTLLFAQTDTGDAAAGEEAGKGTGGFDSLF